LQIPTLADSSRLFDEDSNLALAPGFFWFIADLRRAREPVEHLIVASRRGARHLLVRAVKPAAATLWNRGRGNAWHRNPEGCNRCR